LFSAQNLPTHLALTLDGNRRWADSKGIPRKDAIWHGISKVQEIIQEWPVKFKAETGLQFCKELTIHALTLQNIALRPPAEIQEIDKAFNHNIESVFDASSLVKNGVSIKFGGELKALSSELQVNIRKLEEQTSKCKTIRFNVCIAYDGLQEIKQMVEKHKPIYSANSWVYQPWNSNAYFNESAPIDMYIRTGGEQRLSRFMLLYIGDAELFFTKSLAEEFTYQEFITLLDEYTRRDRRFGK
jgi:undecaprenyl diphosphate synthase